MGVLPEVGSVSVNAQPHSTKVAGYIIGEVVVIFTAQKLPHEDDHLLKTHLNFSFNCLHLKNELGGPQYSWTNICKVEQIFLKGFLAISNFWSFHDNGGFNKSNLQSLSVFRILRNWV